MAVSLVSTGVQFPDSTIQTTAASGSSGATSVGSSIAVLQRGVLLAAPAARMYTLTNNNAASSVLNFDAGNNWPVTPTGYPCYSTYYGAWVTVAYNGSSTSNQYISNLYLSATGAGWVLSQSDVWQANGAQTYTLPGTVMNGPNTAIDESNGRYFTFAVDGANTRLALRYRGTVPGNYGTYSNALLVSHPYGIPDPAFVYPVFNGSSYAGLVFGYFVYGNAYNLGFISPGGTSASSTNSVSYNASSGEFGNKSAAFDHDPTLGRVVWMVKDNTTTPKIMYNTTAGNFTAYSTANAPATTTSWTYTGIACSNTYVAYYNAANNIYYSTSPAGSWTTLTTPLGAGVSNILNLYWVNGYWIAITVDSSTNYVTYISSTAIPNTWTVLGSSSVGAQPNGFALPSKFSIRKV